MIQLFVALPAVTSSSEDLELVYLKPLDKQDAEEVERLLQKVLKGIKITSQEDKSVVYDNSRLNSLLAIVKKAQDNQDDKDNPGIVRLRKLMNDWKDCNNLKETFSPVKVNDVEQKLGLFCAFANMRQSGRDVVVDVDAVSGVEGLKMVDISGNSVDFKVIVCKEEAVYEWFVNHRDPKREIDTAYEKHSEKEKESKKGNISPCTYPKEKSERMLQWAVGSKESQSHRMYFHDLEGKKLLIFWNEDGEGKLFHSYEVPEDNHEEIQKIWTYDDGRALKEAIDRIAKVYLIANLAERK